MTGNYTLPETLHGSTSFSATPSQEDEQIWFIINRAYQNIYGMNMPSDTAYQQVIFDAASALNRDKRHQHLSDKLFMQACEDIIRICDEHHRKAEQHLARARNPLYLRETALDNALEKQRYQKAIGELLPNSAVIAGHHEGSSTALEGRLRHQQPKQPSSSEIMELAYQQLSLNTNQKTSD